MRCSTLRPRCCCWRSRGRSGAAWTSGGRGHRRRGWPSGMLAKLTFAGLVPGAALACCCSCAAPAATARACAAARRRGARARRHGRRAYAVACVGGRGTARPCAPRSAGASTRGPAAAGAVRGLREGSSYLWQLYLPRLPFMEDQFPGVEPDAEPVAQRLDRPLRLAGLSWPETGLPGGALGRSCVIALLALADARPRWRAGRCAAAGSELVTYAAVGGGLLALIGVGGATGRGSAASRASSRRATCCRCCRSTRPRWRWPSRRPGAALAPVVAGRVRGARLRARPARPAAHHRALLRMSRLRGPPRPRRGGRYLDAVLVAVRAQRLDRPMEIVVVDSGSTDGSVAIARRHGARVERDPARGVLARRHAQPADGAGRGRRTSPSSPRTPCPRTSTGWRGCWPGSPSAPTSRSPAARTARARGRARWSRASWRATSRRSPRTARRGSTACAEPGVPGRPTFFSRQRLRRAGGLAAGAVPRTCRTPRTSGSRWTCCAPATRRSFVPDAAVVHSHDYAPLEAASGARSTSSARCARSTASAQPLAPRPVLGRIRARGRARPRVARAGGRCRTRRCPRCAITPCARSGAALGTRADRLPAGGAPAALARAARDLRAHPPVTALLRFRLVRHLLAVFGNLPRRAVLTWRYHGPRETLRRAAARSRCALTPSPARLGLAPRLSDPGAGASRWYRRHWRAGRRRDPDLRRRRRSWPRRSRSIRAHDAPRPRAHRRRRRRQRARARRAAWSASRGIELVARRATGGLRGERQPRPAARARPTRTRVLLNSDVIAHRGWLERLQYAAYREPARGIVGPKLLYADGTIQSAGLDPQSRRAGVVRPPLPLQAGRPPAGQRRRSHSSR